MVFGRRFVWVALGLLLHGWIMCAMAVCDETIHPKRFITHAAAGSPSEQTQLTLKTERGCVLDDEYIMKLRDHDERYREWCCPAASPTYQRRNAEQDDDNEGEEDLPVSIQTFLPWNLDRLDQAFLPLNQMFKPPALLPLASQPQIHIYMVDSGIDVNHRVFRDIDVRLSYTVPEYNTAADCNGHGTKTASIVVGYVTGVVARGVDGVESVANVVVHAVRVVGCDGSGTSSGVIKGLNWIQNYGQRPGVVSMSIGSAKSTAMNYAIENMDNAFAFIAAAGNDGIDAGNTSPSSAAGVIGVGATDTNDNRASYSNTGVFVDVFAPGNGVYGAQMNTYDYIIDDSGTSFAAPAFTGAVVRQMLKTNNNNPVSAANAVLAASTLNVVKNAGTGSANRLLNTLAAAPSPPQLPPQQPSGGGNFPQMGSDGVGSLCCLNWPLFLTAVVIVLFV